MLLSREAILAAQDCPTRDLSVPEWGGTVRLVTLGASERMEWERASFPDGSNVDMQQYMAGLVLRCIVGEDGKPELTADDLAVLGNKNPAVLKRVFDEAADLNGIGAKAAKEAEKNSEATPVDAGNSPSLGS
jgi:hypothetical protein